MRQGELNEDCAIVVSNQGGFNVLSFVKVYIGLTQNTSTLYSRWEHQRLLKRSSDTIREPLHYNLLRGWRRGLVLCPIEDT